MTNAKNTAILQSVRIIDLTSIIFGPLATQMLGDLGADVIKVEAPEGDLLRQVQPSRHRLMGAAFLGANRNKRSVGINLKSSEGVEVLKDLVRDADVLVENFRPSVMDRLGLPYEVLAEVNPRLVYACIRGFGDPRTGESPYVNRPSFDVVAQAMGGAMGITGPDAETPMKIGPGVGDIFPAPLSGSCPPSSRRAAAGRGSSWTWQCTMAF